MFLDLITVKVKLFAIYQEVYQQDEITLKIPQKSQVKDILNVIFEQKPELAKWGKITKLAVNLEFVNPNFVIKHGDEIALIPPVSGG
ncbi:molybdopterin converting factor subunit 1 [Geminocystis sp.]|uniref:molybdopterin converting factor subunit 1 n=1 Tax=Geminocystis sp. TaxID=2664100 RepID=UPI003592F035